MTQHNAILDRLENGERLTGLDALRLCGTMKLASRVSELRRKGYDIKDAWQGTETGKKIKIYWMEV